MVLSLDISHDTHNRHDSYTAWTWLDIHASLRLLSLPISLTLSFVPWASSSNCTGLAPKQLSWLWARCASMFQVLSYKVEVKSHSHKVLFPQDLFPSQQHNTYRNFCTGIISSSQEIFLNSSHVNSIQISCEFIFSMEEDAEFAGKVVFLNEIEGMWFCDSVNGSPVKRNRRKLRMILKSVRECARTKINHMWRGSLWSVGHKSAEIRAGALEKATNASRCIEPRSKQTLKNILKDYDYDWQGTLRKKKNTFFLHAKMLERYPILPPFYWETTFMVTLHMKGQIFHPLQRIQEALLKQYLSGYISLHS